MSTNNIYECLAVDDEPLALEVIQSLVTNHGNLKLVKTCNNAFEAIEWLKDNKPQVIFTDINMPGISGLDFAKAVKDSESVLVFTTAHQEYAIEAFEIEALDFLLKPISPERFAKTVKRIEEYFSLREEIKQDKVELNEGFIFVKSDSKLIKIHYNDIQYVEAFADYVKIWISDEKRVVTLQTMKNMESHLPADLFIRVHRSFIVAKNKITELQSGSLKLGKKEIPVGKNYKDSVMGMVKR